jgi:hypothetical protein
LIIIVFSVTKVGISLSQMFNKYLF